MSNLMKKGDARDSNGKCFRVYPKTKRHKLKNHWGKTKDADKIEAKLQNYLIQQFLTEDLINFDFQQHQKLANHFPTQSRTTSEEVRAHREEVLPPDLEEIYDPQPEVTLEDEDDDHKANQPLSEREIRKLFKLHRSLGHPQPAEFAGGEVCRCTQGSHQICYEGVAMPDM